MKGSTRDLMHLAMAQDHSLLPIMHQLYCYRDVDKILQWLIRNRLTGNNLKEWLKINFENSIMGMVKFIIKYSEKNGEYKPIFAGKDWNPQC